MSAQETTAPDSVALREYLLVLRVHRWSILAIAGLTVLAALFFSLRQTPIYESIAEVLVKPIRTDLQTAVPAQHLVDMDTERRLAESHEVAAIVDEAISGGGPDELLERLSVSIPTNTRVLEFRFADPDPIAAQRGAGAFANAYIEYKTREARRALEDIRRPLLEQIERLTARLRDLNAQVAAQLGGPTPAQQSERDLLNQQLAVARADLPPAIPVDAGDVIRRANLPAGPASPDHLLNAALALIVGLGLGVAVAFLRERLDDRLRGREDLEAQTGAPTLAVIPKIPDWRKREVARLVTAYEPKSAAAEAYRTLRTSMLFAAAQRGTQLVLVASAAAGEGKTTTAANLGMVLAHAGKRVVLISADLRKPRVHRFFNVSNKVGLVNLVAGEVTPHDALMDSGTPGLLILPAGPAPARPAEMLGSEAMGEMLDECRRVADFVIVDTAPLLLVADALAMAPFSDGVLFVADAQVTTRGAVAHARDQLRQVGAEIIGSVLNNFDPAKARSPYYYRSYYRYRYADLEPARPPGEEPRPTRPPLERSPLRRGKETTASTTRGQPARRSRRGASST